MLDIKSLEAEQLKRRSISIRIADFLTSSFGSVTFLVVHAILFAVWLIINTGKLPGIPVFDPFPFIFLTMIVSLEAIFLSIIVLMSENRSADISTLRDELDMQVDLISEREITQILRIIYQIARKQGIKLDDPELKEMLKETDVSYIERQIQEQIEKRKKKS